MENYCITISRQYGSGGRKVGITVAQRLGIHYYDKILIQKASEESGISEKLFGKVDEYFGKARTTFPPAKGPAYTGTILPPDHKDFFSVENLFAYQAKAIKDVCSTQSCVIIGRCSNYILRNEPHVLRVFIHADWSYRMEHAREFLSLNDADLERFLKKDDKRKTEFVRYYTGREWTDATQYDLCLDSGKLGFDGCVEAILAYLPEAVHGSV